MSSTGRRVVISDFGSAEVLQVVEETVLEPGPGEVQIRMEAASVATGDILARQGANSPPPRPFTPGFDVVGTVEAIGPGDSDFTVGDRVGALVISGGNAELVTVAADRLVSIPAGLVAANAAAAVLPFATAFQLIHRAAKVQAGQTVLVHGAAGGVGSALVQLSRLAGARVFGTASAGHLEAVRLNGATPIDYRADDFVQRIREETSGVDAVFDAIGGAHLTRSRRALRRGGVVVLHGIAGAVRDGRPDQTAVARAGLALVLAMLDPRVRALMYDVRAESRKRPERLREDVATILGLAADGAVTPAVGGLYPLGDVRAAHRAVEDGHLNGRAVLIPE